MAIWQVADYGLRTYRVTLPLMRDKPLKHALQQPFAILPPLSAAFIVKLLKFKQMKIETKEIYKCDYCRKAYQIKRACEYHEKICKKNPANDRPCFHCNTFEKKDIEHYEYYGDRDYKVNLSVFFCKAKDIYLYPPQVEIKNNPKDFGKTNEPMPKECDKLSTGWSL